MVWCGACFGGGWDGGGGWRKSIQTHTYTHIHPHIPPMNETTDQRALGFSMRVERVGVDKVKERLSALKQKEEAQKTAVRGLSGMWGWRWGWGFVRGRVDAGGAGLVRLCVHMDSSVVVVPTPPW